MARSSVGFSVGAAVLVCLGPLVPMACSGSSSNSTGGTPDAGSDSSVDAGNDAELPDSTIDTGEDSGTLVDSSSPMDSGTMVDSGMPATDTGTQMDSAVDTGMPNACDGAASCASPTDCPALSNDCLAATCTTSCCGSSPKASETACTTSGGRVCDGNGNCVDCVVVGDCPAQTTVCLTNTCTTNTCGTSNAALETACTDNGGKVCNGSGECVQCNTPADCPATGNVCTGPACTTGTCGVTDFGMSIAPPSLQTTGDCQEIVCNGAGGTTSINDATDLPTPTSVCQTNPACTGNPLAPSFTPAAAGTDCTADGMLPKHLCGSGNAAGTCVQCNTDSDCAVINDAGTLTCNNHVCQ